MTRSTNQPSRQTSTNRRITVKMIGDYKGDVSMLDRMLGGLLFDVAFTSVLKRAIRTLWIVLEEMDLMWLPVHGSWRLNERHYGALQGLNKAETAEQFGDEQVKLWRRSYAVRPPALEDNDPRHPRNDARSH